MDSFIQQIGWFGCTISATVIYGILNFMYKIAAVHNCSAHKILNTSAAVVALLSLIAIIISGSKFENIEHILFFAIINSAFFGLGSIVKMKSLEKIPASIAFPITKLNSVFLIVYSLVLFSEKPTFFQWIGIGLSLSMLAYISINIKDKDNSVQGSGSSKVQTLGLVLAILAAFSTSISMLTGKYASTEVSKINYMFISYSLVMVYTFIISKFYSKKDKKITKDVLKKTYLFGIIIGILNFVGYFLVLNAFAIGPLSLIQGISSNAFIIPILLSIIVYKEKLNYKKIIVIVLAIVSVLMIKL